MVLLQYLKRIDKPSEKPKVTLLSKVNWLSECQLQHVNDHIRKTVGDKATTSGIDKKRRYQTAALNHVCTCFARWFGFHI